MGPGPNGEMAVLAATICRFWKTGPDREALGKLGRFLKHQQKRKGHCPEAIAADPKEALEKSSKGATRGPQKGVTDPDLAATP
jgi:hypothetical protein